MTCNFFCLSFFSLNLIFFFYTNKKKNYTGEKKRIDERDSTQDFYSYNIPCFVLKEKKLLFILNNNKQESI